MQSNIKLRKLCFYTKDPEELIDYKSGSVTMGRPLIYVYEHFGSEEEALKAFMDLGSFAMGGTGDSFLAFPLKGIPKVMTAINVEVLYRVEDRKVTPFGDYCKLCKNRIKRALSGCKVCEGLKMLPQLHPMRVMKMKNTIEFVEHHSDKRSPLKKREGTSRAEAVKFMGDI